MFEIELYQISLPPGRGRSGFEIKPRFNFFFYKNVSFFGFFAALFCLCGDRKNSKQEANLYSENVRAKLQNSNQISTFSWVNLAQELRF